MAGDAKRYNFFREFPVTQILAELEADDLLPAILFRSARKQCDEDVERLQSAKIGEVSEKHQNIIKDEIKRVIGKYQLDPLILEEHPHYQALINTASGAHHAGQLLQWRLLLEELMSRGVLRLMVATGTVAAGVDFPARAVVITAHSRRGNDGFVDLSAAEFQQMSGRAGRRGKDAVGVCLVAPGQFSDARVIYEVSRKPPEPLKSSYFAAPSTVLNLLKFRSVDEMKYTVERSLAAFYDRRDAKKLRHDADRLQEVMGKSERPRSETKKLEKRVRRLIREAERLEMNQEIQLELAFEGLRSLGYLDERGLTDKGLWAADLCTSLVLQLCEAINEGLFFDLSEDKLAMLVASIAGDAHRHYFSLAENPISKEVYQEFQYIIHRVQDQYHGPTTTSDVEVVPDAALTVHTWMYSENWSSFASLLKLSGVAEGDAARLITQTADHLQQISRLQDSHPDLARTAWQARSILLRPPLSDSLVVDSIS